MQQLISAIHHGWPLRRKDCPAKLVPYYDSRSELVEDGGLDYRGERLVVPQLLRADMLKEIHRSHFFFFLMGYLYSPSACVYLVYNVTSSIHVQ